MIERKFIEEKKAELKAMKFLEKYFKGKGYSKTEILKIPLGYRVIIYTSKPGAIIGRRGENIEKLKKILQEKFNFENPQIEIREVENKWLDPNIVAEMICKQIERLGVGAFKAIAHRALDNILKAGARGAEVVISGKVPSDRAHSWRFKAGYLPKTGDIANYVLKAKKQVLLKPGVVGVKVAILPKDVPLPDEIKIAEPVKEEEVREVEENIFLE